MPTMLIELTFREGWALREALRAAFRSQAALAQIVFDQSGVPLSQIAEDGSYREVITRLILWVEEKEYTANLIAWVRQANADNLLLREFEDQYKKRRPPIPLLPNRVITPELRRQLVSVLLRLFERSSYITRSTLLSGIPGNLNRNEGNAQADFEMIIEQLDGLGRTDSGSWSLVLFIDNALSYAQGFSDPTAILEEVRAHFLQLQGDV